MKERIVYKEDGSWGLGRDIRGNGSMTQAGPGEGWKDVQDWGVGEDRDLRIPEEQGPIFHCPACPRWCPASGK